MRLAIVNLTCGGLSGGYRKYLRELLPRLAVRPGVDCLLVAVPAIKELYDLQLALEQVTWVNYVPSRLFKLLPSSVLNSVSNFDPDVIFIPTARTFRLGHVPVVTMVRNMEPVSYHGWNPFSERLVNLFRRKEAKRAARQAKRVIAVSRYVKQHLLETWGLQDGDIGVVYHGVDRISETKRPNLIPVKWEGNFLFTAGSVRPARGLEDLLKAFARISIKSREKCRGLVVAGTASGNMASYYEKLKEIAEELGIGDNLCWAGDLIESELAWCYRNCRVFVMTSRVEACPNIALEAMANGCVIISTRNAPMPEFFGDVAIYYNQGNDEELETLIEHVLEISLYERVTMKDRATNRVTKFTWDSTAEITVQELAKAMNR